MNSKEHIIIRTAGLVINAQTGNLLGKNSIQQRLSPVNMKVLQLLASNHGNVVSRVQIFNAVWPNQDISDDALTRCISDIRSVLGKLSEQATLIETIPKKGYRWLQPVVIENEALNIGTAAQPNRRQYQALTWVKWLPLYVLAALVMLTLSVWIFIVLAGQPSPSIAILTPIDPNTQTRNYHDALFVLLVEHPKLDVLSQKATNHQNESIYPLLYQRFGTRWTIETSTREKSNGNISIVTSLVDARNAFVIFRQVNSYDEKEDWAKEEAQAFFNNTVHLLITKHNPKTLN